MINDIVTEEVVKLGICSLKINKRAYFFHNSIGLRPFSGIIYVYDIIYDVIREHKHKA